MLKRSLALPVFKSHCLKQSLCVIECVIVLHVSGGENDSIRRSVFVRTAASFTTSNFLVLMFSLRSRFTVTGAQISEVVSCIKMLWVLFKESNFDMSSVSLFSSVKLRTLPFRGDVCLNLFLATAVSCCSF